MGYPASKVFSYVQTLQKEISCKIKHTRLFSITTLDAQSHNTNKNLMVQLVTEHILYNWWNLYTKLVW